MLLKCSYAHKKSLFNAWFFIHNIYQFHHLNNIRVCFYPTYIYIYICFYPGSTYFLLPNYVSSLADSQRHTVGQGTVGGHQHRRLLLIKSGERMTTKFGIISLWAYFLLESIKNICQKVWNNIIIIVKNKKLWVFKFIPK